MMGNKAWDRFLFAVAMSIVLGLPYGETKFIQFRVHGRNLITSSDSNGKPEAYAEIFFEGRKLGETSHGSDDQYPRWGETFDLDYNENSESQIEVKVWDDFTWWPDTHMGSTWAHPNHFAAGVERGLWRDSLYAGRIRIELV